MQIPSNLPRCLANLSLAAGLLVLSAACAGGTGRQPAERPASPDDFTRVADARGAALVRAARAPNSPYGDYLAGLVARRNQDLGRAADFMRQALAFDPDNIDLLIDAFSLTAAEGRFTEAVELAQRIEEVGIQHGTAVLILTVDEVLRGDYEAADTRLESAPQKGLTALVSPLLRAWIAVAQDDREAALALLEPLKERRGFGALYRFHLAMMLDVLGDSATEAYETALAESEQPSYRLLALAGNYFERNGQAARAAALYADFMARNPESLLLEPSLESLAEERVPEPILGEARDGMAAALFDIASVLTQERAQEISLIYGQLARALAPQMTIARVLIGEILQQQGRREEAIALYRTVPRGSPFEWSVRLRISEELNALGRDEDAVAELRKLAAERPERFEPLYRIGNLLRGQERFAEAAGAYDEAMNRVGEPQAQHWSLLYFRGIALERSKEWDRAEADFLKALELRPEQPYVMNYLAYSWVEQKRNLERAEEMLKRAVELEPEDGYIVDSLGWVYYRLGRFEEAVSRLERAVELRPEDPVINDHLGDAYWRTGRHREARVQWQRALSLEPEDDQVDLIEAKIQQGLEQEPQDI